MRQPGAVRRQSSREARAQDSQLQLPLVPDHTLLRPIGWGSYGQVWLARNSVGTLRAIKVVHRQNFERDEHAEREFNGLRRFEPVSRLHEGLVDILQLGQNGHAEYFYYVMEIADAVSGDPTKEDSLETYAPRTLREDLQNDYRIPLAQCLQIGLKLSAALEHLHRHNLVHRDIKPSNIVFVQGQPKLADIGLVARIDEAHSLVGTAGYIPPEGPGSIQADIYSLGKVMYEMAFAKDRQEFPQLPADLRQLPDHADLLELNEVIMKSCSTDPQQRYQSAQALHDDLARLNQGQSLRNRNLWRKRIRAGRKIASVTALLGLVLAPLVWSLMKVETPTRQNDVNLVAFKSSGTQNLEAFKAYQLGRFYLAKRTSEGITNAIENLQRAVALDNRFARAYAALGNCYNLATYSRISPEEAKTKARAAVALALALDDSLADAHAAMARFKFQFEWDWAGAERDFQKALALNANDPETHLQYAVLLSALSQPEAAIREVQRALDLDPTSLVYNCNLGIYLRRAHRPKEAIVQLKKALRLDPNFVSAANALADSYEDLGQFDLAMDVSEKTYRLRQGDPAGFEPLREAYRKEGIHGYWRKVLQCMSTNSPKAIGFAWFYARLGQTNEAISWLERACQNRDDYVKYINADPTFDVLHEHPRFQALLARMGLTSPSGL